MQTDQTNLRLLLSASDHYATVKLGEGGIFTKIPRLLALALLDSGEYNWQGSASRVKHMTLSHLRPLTVHAPNRAALPWRSCWRTTAAAVLYPSESWQPR